MTWRSAKDRVVFSEDAKENRCTVLAVLETGHIKPYQGEDDSHPENGLLLRSDIHTLFDLDLLGIAPDRLQVQLHPILRTEYGDLVGMHLGCRSGLLPS